MSAESGVQNGGERNFASVTVYSYWSDGSDAVADDVRVGGRGEGGAWFVLEEGVFEAGEGRRHEECCMAGRKENVRCE